MLDGKHHISEEEKVKFTLNGHIHIRGILSEKEVKHSRQIINAAVDRLNTETRPIEDRDTYGKAFLQIMNLWRSDKEVADFVLSKRLASVACQLLDTDAVRIYHDQALYKEPNGGPTPWHQDQFYWPIDTTKTVTMWMPLIDIDQEMGMLTFASGSHKEGIVLEKEISDESEELLSNHVKSRGFQISSPTSMKAGDASWHLGHTLHFAPGNSSKNMREVMTIIYIADGARITEPKNSFQVNDLKTWIPGKHPGDLVASDLNPIIRP